MITHKDMFCLINLSVFQHRRYSLSTTKDDEDEIISGISTDVNILHVHL